MLTIREFFRFTGGEIESTLVQMLSNFLIFVYTRNSNFLLNFYEFLWIFIDNQRLFWMRWEMTINWFFPFWGTSGNSFPLVEFAETQYHQYRIQHETKSFKVIGKIPGTHYVHAISFIWSIFAYLCLVHLHTEIFELCYLKWIF